MRPTNHTHVIAGIAAVLALTVACGGDEGGPTTTTETPTTVGDASEDIDTGSSEDTPSDEDGATDEDGADNGTADRSDGDDLGDPEPDGYEPGDIGFRVVNLLDEPVDLYVRTTGLVEAFPAALGTPPGAITELFFPPDSGRFIVAEAGAGDPTCVGFCDHFIAELSASPDDGPVRTVLLYTDEFGQRRSFDLWEQPDPARTGNANAMVQADPTTGLAVVVAVALSDAAFGLRLSLEGTPGCAEPVNLTNVLVGGNQTPAFALGNGTASIVLHANDDRECVATAVGGPFAVPTAAGSRSIVILAGSPGDMDAIVVPMVDDEGPTSTAGDDPPSGTGGSASSVDVERAVTLFAEALGDELGFPPAEARCASELLVDAIGPEVLLDGDQLTDLDALPIEIQDAATDALIIAIGLCDIDLALLDD